MSKRVVFGTLLALCAIVTLILPGNIQPVEAAQGNIIATYGQGYLEDVNGLLVVHVKGSPYEMGYQYGFLLRDRIESLTQYCILAEMDKGYSYQQLVQCGQVMEAYIPEEYVEEMQGLADAANVSYTDLLIFHAIPVRASLGCSTFVVFGNATADGHLYHGRNHDWPWSPDAVELASNLVTIYEPEEGNPYALLGSDGRLGSLSGMNKHGISLGMTGSTSQDTTLYGMPFWFMNKRVLQYSENLAEAIQIICETPRERGATILLGDAKGLNAAVVEISANYSKVFWPGDPAEDIEPHYSIPNAIRRTNHYVDPELAATQRDPYDPRVEDPEFWIGYNSWLRYEKLSQLIGGNYSNIDAETSIGCLRTPPVAWDPINVQSTVFDSTDLEMWVACANSTTPAYEREYVHLSSEQLFPEAVLSISSTTGGNVTDPGEGTFAYDEGAVVDLVAEGEEGYHFVEWTGDASTIADAEAATTTITMEDDYEITANFQADAPGLCFIATAAYGTPMADEVQTLRDFRDEYMLTNPLGQAFVDFYYKVSPPIAKFITDHPSLKPFVRAGLVPAVVMSAVVVQTTATEKGIILGILMLVSVAVVIVVTRRRGRGLEYN